MNENQLISNKEETEMEGSEVIEEAPVDEKDRLTAELQEMNNKYLRLYAEFENYKKRVNKDKEELVKYGNESLLYELLPVIDNLEMALKHASDNVSAGVVQGVEITLKELQKTLEKTCREAGKRRDGRRNKDKNYRGGVLVWERRLELTSEPQIQL